MVNWLSEQLSAICREIVLLKQEDRERQQKDERFVAMTYIEQRSVCPLLTPYLNSVLSIGQCEPTFI